MCIHEVTQKEWFAYMTTLPTKYTKHLGDDYPIDCISINKAIEYCNKRSLAENLQPCYIKEGSLYFCDFKANGYRLPTESEWEYAAKGGKNKDTYVYSGSNSLESVAWTNGPHIVMTKNSNSIGLLICQAMFLNYVGEKINITIQIIAIYEEDQLLLKDMTMSMMFLLAMIGLEVMEMALIHLLASGLYAMQTNVLKGE